MDIGQYLQPKKEKDDKFMRTVAVLALVVAVAQLVVSLKQIGGPIFAWTGLVLSLGILLTAASIPFLKVFRRLRIKSSDKAFIAQHETAMKDLFERFLHHTSESISNQPYLLIRNAIDSDPKVFDTIFASRALGSWQTSLETRFARPVVDINDFVQRCHDFTMLVHHYNVDVVVKARGELQKLNTPKAVSYAEPLETFRTEFTRFLQDVELWAKKVNEFALKRFPQKDFYKISPHTQFERVGSFAKSEPAKAN